MRDQELGDVRTQVCHTVARIDPRRLQGTGKASGFGREIAIGGSPVTVDDRHLVRINLGGALQEAQRGQRAVRDGGHGTLLSDKGDYQAATGGP